ncbi:MAG TPA: hypothetical protein VFO83_00015 [Aggregicoccus sp.]|nr:hypothetical protein [Aggregicoccus sp.]
MRQAEAKSGLKALYVTQKAYFSEKSRYTADIGALGFQPERGNRFMYALGDCDASNTENRDAAVAVRHEGDVCIGADRTRFPGFPAGGVFPAQLPTSASWTAGSSLSGMTLGVSTGAACPGCDFVAAAVGDVDGVGGAGADTWLVSSSSATMTANCPVSTDTVSAGEAYNSYQDTACD